MKVSLCIGAAVVAVLVPFATVSAQVASPMGAPAPARTLTNAVLKAGTPVSLHTDVPLTSKKAKVGDQFPMTVDQDVAVDGRVLIPAGTHAVGEVTKVSKRGVMAHPGKIETRPLYADVAGNHVALTGSSVTKGKGTLAAAGMVAGVAAFGPLAIIITGKSAVLKAGTPIAAQAAGDTELAVGGYKTGPVASIK